MESVIFRFIFVWLTLHIILFFIEVYRYRHGRWSWNGFKNNGMLEITYCILFIDILSVGDAIIVGLVYWILQPIN